MDLASWTASSQLDTASWSCPSSQCAWAAQAVPCTSGRVPTLSDTALLACFAASFEMTQSFGWPPEADS